MCTAVLVCGDDMIFMKEFPDSVYVVSLPGKFGCPQQLRRHLNPTWLGHVINGCFYSTGGMNHYLHASGSGLGTVGSSINVQVV
jgi:hypothetical protein